MDDHPASKVQQFMLMTREEDFLICDRLTREQRKIVKCVSVVDLYDMSVFSGDADRRFAKALGDSSNMSTDLYPQFLAKTVLINLPSVINWVIRILKMFMSERSFNKIQFHQVCGHGLPKEQGDLTKLVEMDEDQVSSQRRFFAPSRLPHISNITFHPRCQIFLAVLLIPQKR